MSALRIHLEISEELEKAVAKWPNWPNDPLHAIAVIGEEFGEMTKESLDLVYAGFDQEETKQAKQRLRKEAIQTAAMLYRFIASIESYEYEPSENHSQE
jgi:hypothetical protein